MNRTLPGFALPGFTLLAFTFFAATTAALSAQQGSQPDPYQGTSNPPSDSTIVVTTPVQPKPRAGKPLNAAVPVTAPPVAAQAPDQAPPSTSGEESKDLAGQAQVGQDQAPPPPPAAEPDSGMQAVPAPALSTRGMVADPDGDIVHPAPLGPGQLGEGTNIQVTLLDRLSTVESEKGEPFRSKVELDVLQGGQVVIPAGSEIDGRVVDVSSGHLGGHGSMRLRPESVVLPDGSRFALHAELTGTPGSRTRLRGEGTILPGSRARRDEIEYGGAVGAGVITGAVIGGPVGAVTGGAIGAGAVTAHLLINHPEATLEPGAVLQFTLTDTLSLTPAVAPGN